MKFLIGYSKKYNQFVFGKLNCRGGYTSFAAEVVRPYCIGSFGCEDRVREYLNDCSAEMLIEALKKYDCTYNELTYKIRENNGIEFFFDVDEDLSNVSEKYLFEIEACGQHDPRNDEITDWFIPEILFDKIMLFWDYYHLDNTPEAFEDYNYLTSKLMEGGYDSLPEAERWMKKFLVNA